jgi:hypothetical protein
MVFLGPVRGNDTHEISGEREWSFSKCGNAV